LKGRTSYHTTYTRSSQRYGDRVLTVQIVCRYHKGRYRRQGVKHFAYILIGQLKLSPQQLFEEYRRRFGIETGYRLMNTMRARTTSKWVALRLFLVALALLLLNLWHYVKWQYLFVPRPGPRQLLHHLLPLARWRLLYCRDTLGAETVWQHRGSVIAVGKLLFQLEKGGKRWRPSGFRSGSNCGNGCATPTNGPTTNWHTSSACPAPGCSAGGIGFRG
jgi:putative transposase